MLLEIFTYNIRPICYQNQAKRNTLRELVLLSHICRNWRRSTLCMTALWKTMTLNLYIIRQRGPPLALTIRPQTVDLVSWWETYLGNTPSSVFLSLDFIYELPNTFTCNDMETATPDDTIVAFLARPFFRSVRSLNMKLGSRILDIICKNPAPFPNLLDLRIENEPSFGQQNLPISALPSAPRLSCLYIYYWRDNIFFNRFPTFPWVQLSHLYILRPIPYDFIRTILKSCTRVQMAVLDWTSVILAYFPVLDGDIILTSMLQLVVYNQSTQPFSFQGFIFPALSALRMITSHPRPNMDADEISSVLRKTPALTELHIDGLLQFSDNMSLAFEHVDLDFEHDLSSLLPRLQHLDIYLGNSQGFNSEEIIIQFLKCDWLCGGWFKLDSSGTRIHRKLKLVTDVDRNSSDYWESESIISGVQQYLDAGWHDDDPFEVSLQRASYLASEYSSEASRTRRKLDVFDQRTLGENREWDSAIDFHTSL